MIQLARTAAVFTLLATLIAGCVSAPRPRAEASPAKIAIEVTQNTMFAGGLKDETAGHLRALILQTKAGVPVTDASHADLVLKVNILKANFTQATQFDWQLIDRDSGAIVASDASSVGVGGWSAKGLARVVVGKVAALDTAPYASDTAVAAAKPMEPAAASSQASAPASKTDGKNAWAVVIGVERYREKLPVATGAEADALAFADYARNTLNVPEANVKVLLGERATRADMSAALLEWLPRNAVEPGGKVYVFFSGHGAPDVETGSSYLLPYEANPTYIKSGGLSVTELQDQLAGLKEQQVYVFLDACFSGTGERSVLAEGTRPVVPVKDIAPVGGVVTFSASGPDETTGAHAAGKHGLFTFHLLEGLGGGADANGDGDVTVAELAAHVTETVKVDARRQNRDQTPTVAVAKPKDRERVLVRGVSR